MKTNRRTFSFSLLAISVLSATSAMAADTDSPFATPLHLSNPGMSKTVTITKNETIPKVATWDVSNTSTSLYEKNKPNIMLYLDDSGSMIGEKENSLKRVLPDLIREYGDKASWGLSWMESINSSSNAHNTEIGLTDDYQRIINAISNSRYNGGTPFLTGYVNAVDKFAKTPIPLSCTNNYIIAMTDGSENSDRYQDVNPRISSSEVWQAANVSEYPKLTVSGKTFEPYQFGEDGGSYNQRWDGWAGDYYSDTWGTSYYLWYSRKGQVKSNSLYGLSSSEVDYLDSIFLKQLSDPLLKNTNIKTYTVAYGMGTSSGDRRTKHMLKKGAIGEGMYNGNPTYFDANDEQGLRDAFARMFEEMTKQSNDGTQPVAIVDGSPSTVKPTVGESTGASSVHTEESKHAIAAPTVTGDDTQIRPEENVALWLPIGEEKGLRSAELRFYKPDYDAQDPKAYLPTLPVDSTYGTPNYTTYRHSFISDKNSVSTMDSYFMSGNNTYFALNAIGTKSDEWDQALLPWLSRSKKDSDIQALGYKENTDYRTRTYPMGDILESDILTVGDLVDGNSSTGFKGRKQFVVAAANDGMAYIFKSNAAQNTVNASTPYNLMMTYAPSALQRQNTDDTLATHYKKLAKEDYAQTPDNPHLYMLSGGISGHTLNKPFKIEYMVGNAGRGAKGLYAMNISAINESSDRNWQNTVPLFDAGAHRGGNESQMGYTVGYSMNERFGQNVLKKDSSGKFERSVDNGIHMYTAVGSGFSTKTDLEKQETALYIYDTFGGADVGIEGCGYDKSTLTSNHKNSVSCVGSKEKRGQLVTKVSLGNTGGLATPALYDVDGDHVMDYIFAGDYSGNMYRCDVRDYKNVSCSMIFKGSKDRPVTSAPIIARLDNGEFVVTWGTGSDMFPADITENKRQALYAVYQKFDELNNIDKEYAGKTFTESDLLKQDITSSKGSWETYDLQRTVDGEYKNGSKMRNGDGTLAYQGWMLELDATKGERVVTRPMLVLRTVYYTTRVYGKVDKTVGHDSSWNENWTESEWIANDWKTTGWQDITTGGVTVCSTNDDDIQNGRGGWSIKQLIDESSSTTAAASTDKCTNHSSTSTTVTQKYQSTCTEGNSKQIQWTKNIDGSVAEQYSAIFQLDIGTGSTINPRKTNTYVLLGSDKTDSSNPYIAGDSVTSLISSMSFPGFVSWRLHDPERKGMNFDKHNNQYDSGIHADIKKEVHIELENTNVMKRDNNCAPDDGEIKYALMGRGQKDQYFLGGNKNIVIANCLRRISWREIY